ncbi:MAG: tetratricopeptide repeat protein, partial [Deltaproteobacteria bacterium]
MSQIRFIHVLRSLALSLCLIGGAALVCEGVAVPQAFAKKKKKKKKPARRDGSDDDSTAAPAKPKAPSILSTKSAVTEKKVRMGPARYQSAMTASERDAKADEKRDEEIEEIKKIIPKIQDGPQKADLLFQLSELWWEKSKFVYYREMAAYDQAYQQYQQQQNSGGKAGREPVVNTRQSDLYRQEAINLYQKILADYPTYPRKDEVLFNLAYNLYEVGKKKDAIARYWDL